MESLNLQKGQFIGLPFYFFITALMGALAYFGVRDLWESGSLGYSLACALFFVLHVGLYWLNLKMYPVKHWWTFYYAAQTLLILGLVSLPYQGEIAVTLLGSTVISIIAEALGWWGNTRRSLKLGLFYFVLALVVLLRLVAPGDLGLALSSLFVNGGFIILFMLVLNQQLAERQKAVDLAESLESANAKLAASAAKIEALTLQNERQRMARELHDTLAQGVAGLVLQLEAVKAHLAASRTERASAIVEQALTRARSTLAESRAAIDDLRAAPLNLADSVREKVERFSQATGIPCDLELSVAENLVLNDAGRHALHVMAEALENIVRHARASRAAVKFVALGDRLEVEIRDDGQGFDVGAETGAGHYGLLGMRERARLMGGSLVIQSDGQHGTLIRLVVAGGAQ